MSTYSATLGGRTHSFAGLAGLLAAASPERSGDRLAGLAADSAQARVAARWALAEVPLARFLAEPVIPYETDDVTRLIMDSHDTAAFAPVSGLTVGELREWLLSDVADAATLAALAPGLSPEMVAAVSKLMGNADLVAVARKVQVVTAFRSTIGLPGRLATRLQPNHPTDDPAGVAAALLDGLLLGSGDAVIGINPATDSPRAVRDLLDLLDGVIDRYSIPTQSCVLCHVTTSIDLMERGAPVDLVFQSIAGTQAANASFGVTLGLLDEAYEAARSLARGTVGSNALYFETGQGSALSADAHHGVDQQTVEARAYAVARRYDPLLVNTVVGFIGPEYLYDGRQILRAALEDHFCGKLLGLPMGLDICYTNHADADDDDIATMLTMLGVAGASFVICTPGGDDIMLNYQSASYHDALYLREVLGLRPAPEFETWLGRIGLLDEGGGIRDVAGTGHPLTAIGRGLAA
ncbi:ethanolamine ammonia-lyase subunit EutB [Streptomyces mirabilis]|uniref:ethanolamine ammonia-lyase subunit EutB n=1 Tax=Streptomyces mirabilis TaxID=68239 RepID=UPI0037193970